MKANAFLRKELGKHTFIPFCLLLVGLASCRNPNTFCPDEATVRLYFSHYDNTTKSSYSIYPSGKVLDGNTIEATATNGEKTLALNSLDEIPLDVSHREITLIYKQQSRRDTMKISYELLRQDCINVKNSMYLKVINAKFTKNTFNETHPSIRCNLAY